jgi:hypothetical protein
MNYHRFQPRDAVDILADRRRTKELKTWAIARLLSWISLDQRPRRTEKLTASEQEASTGVYGDR